MHNKDEKFGIFRQLKIHQDPGEDVVMPSISLAGIIVVSVFLGIHLLGLLLLALYAAFSPTWTDHLDAFAMMRLGATISETDICPWLLVEK